MNRFIKIDSSRLSETTVLGLYKKKKSIINKHVIHSREELMQVKLTYFLKNKIKSCECA